MAGALAGGAALALHADSLWYSGIWDSSLYAWSRAVHPRTVVVRVELLDANSRLPVHGAEVILRGTYQTEHLGLLDNPSVPRSEPREYEASAQTNEMGVAVFALSWEKEYPWSQQRPKLPDKFNPGSWRYADSWDRPVDDIEKVQFLEIRAAHYDGALTPFNFSPLLEFGQNQSSESQPPDVLDRFQQAWQNELRNPDVRFCVLHLGAEFTNYGDKRCAGTELFDRIARKDFGYTYEQVPNLSGFSPREYAGPYFVYLIQFTIERQQSDVNLHVEQSAPSVAEMEHVRTSSSPEAPRVASPPAPSSRNLRSVSASRPPNPPAQAIASAPLERADQSVTRPAVETVTSGLIQQRGLFPGTTGVYLNESVAGLPAGVVVESIQHRAIGTDSDFYAAVAATQRSGQVAVGIWRRGASGRWERAQVMVLLGH
jgi:hypothetical protein